MEALFQLGRRWKALTSLMVSPSNMGVKDRSVTDGRGGLLPSRGPGHQYHPLLPPSTLHSPLNPAALLRRPSVAAFARFIMTAWLPRCVCQHFEDGALSAHRAVNAPSLTLATAPCGRGLLDDQRGQQQRLLRKVSLNEGVCNCKCWRLHHKDLIIKRLCFLHRWTEIRSPPPPPTPQWLGGMRDSG